MCQILCGKIECKCEESYIEGRVTDEMGKPCKVKSIYRVSGIEYSTLLI